MIMRRPWPTRGCCTIKKILADNGMKSKYIDRICTDDLFRQNFSVWPIGNKNL
jgi:hypothetical protein